VKYWCSYRADCRDIEENLAALKSRRSKREAAVNFNYNDFNTLEDVSRTTDSDQFNREWICHNCLCEIEWRN